MKLHISLGLALLFHVAAAQAQNFPEGASTLSSQELKTRLDDKTFAAKLADGTSWRLEFNARGHFFIDASNGFRAKGDWGVEDGKLCSQITGRERRCNEVRLHQDVLHLKRDSGEIVQYQPK